MSAGRRVVLYLLAALIVLLTGPIVRAQPRRNLLETHRQQHGELQGKLADSLRELAAFCDEKGFAEPAREIRRLAEPFDSKRLQIDSLPSEVRPDLPADLPADERYWRAQLRHLQQEYAQDLHLLARRVMNAGSPSYAYQLIREAAYHDPDHKTVRGLLGYVRYGDEWVTPFAARMLRNRNVWHDRYGWLLKTHVDRYEQGERNFKGRWMSAEQEAEIRRDFRNAWEINTDHFLVKTNHSLERGVEIASALENFYQIFFETFAGFYNSPQQMQQLFNGAAGRGGSHVRQEPFEVHYYRTRDEYNQRLKAKIPQIEITNGLYYTTDRTSYFFHDPEVVNLATVFHEATHQLFYESQRNERAIGVNSDFWIVEGIACYMESFAKENGRLALGDPNYVRFRAGRFRYLNDNYYVPLEQFAAMGMQAFQTDKNLARNYSQASSLAHFFMHYDGGRYRDALVDHLAQIYNGRLARPKSLEELTGATFGTLDRQYGEYVRALEDELQQTRIER